MRQRTGMLIFLTVWLTSCGASEEPHQPEQPGTGAAKLSVEASGAVWVAYRDGEGAWQVLRGSPESADEERYTLELKDAETRYGVAHVCADEAGEVNVVLSYATLAEGASVATPCPSDEADADFYTLSGSLSGLAEGETARVYGEFLADKVTSAENTYALAGFTAGVYDLLVTVQRASATPDEFSPPKEMLVRRDIAVQNDKVLDLDLGQAVSTSIRNVTIDNVASGSEVSSSVSLVTERGASAELGAFVTEAAQTAFSFDYAGLTAPTDRAVYHLSVGSFSEEAGGALLSRSLRRTFAAPENVTLSLPEPLGAAELRSEEARLKMIWRTYAADASYTLTLEDSSETSETRYVVALSAPWLLDAASEAELSYPLPDFSALPGWSETWTLGADPFWKLSAHVERGDEAFSVSRSSAVSASSVATSTRKRPLHP